MNTVKDMLLFDDMALTEKQVDSTNVYDGRLLHVYRDHIILPSGKQTTREYIRHNGAVAIVALDENENVVVEHQYRYPFHSQLLEIPAGKLDSADEVPLEAAKRELREETGFVAENYEYLGPFYPTCAYSTEIIHMYLATGLSHGERELDDDENINLRMMKLEDLVDVILEGKVPDGKTQAAVLAAWGRLKKGKQKKC